MIANQEALHDLNPDQPFLSAVLALFNGEKSGNLYSYMYGEGRSDEGSANSEHHDTPSQKLGVHETKPR